MEKPEQDEYYHELDMPDVAEGRVKYLIWFLLNRVPNIDRQGFDMDQVLKSSECGTLRCISGWAGELFHNMYSIQGMLGSNFTEGYFAYCFFSEWKDVDNSIEGACIRLWQVMRNQAPEKKEISIESYKNELKELKAAFKLRHANKN